MRQTLVAVNAHPDDEAILMGGTLAKASAQGHTVVLITATDGGFGPAGLGARRMGELAASAQALGAHAVVDLGYADSGMGPGACEAVGPREPLHLASLDTVAAQIADRLADHEADVVIGYDRAGGYGHRDHVTVHHAVRRAVALRPTRLVEATAPREPILRALAVGRRMGLLGDFDPQEWAQSFTTQRQITHRVDVRDCLAAKRAALAAHVSQAHPEQPRAGGDARTMATVLALPGPVFNQLMRTEFFLEPDRHSPAPNRRTAFSDLIGCRHTRAGG